MIDLQVMDNNYTLSFSKDDINDDLLKKILEFANNQNDKEFDDDIDEGAFRLSEEIKQEWWDKNGKQLLERVGIKDENSN